MEVTLFAVSWSGAGTNDAETRVTRSSSTIDNIVEDLVSHHRHRWVLMVPRAR